MGKMLYSATISADGFMAGPGGDMSWLTPYLGPNSPMEDVVDEILLYAPLATNLRFRVVSPE